MLFEEDVDFLVLEPISENRPSPIKILKQPYNDIIIEYGKVRVLEHESSATLQFAFNVLESGTYSKTHLTESKNFKNFLGDLLRDMIIEAGTHNTKQSNS